MAEEKERIDEREPDERREQDKHTAHYSAIEKALEVGQKRAAGGDLAATKKQDLAEKAKNLPNG